MQITEKLYDKNSYLQEFTATIVSCEQKDDTTYRVVLDQTAFFPEGGGQAADLGMLGEAVGIAAALAVPSAIARAPLEILCAWFNKIPISAKAF